jgi:hypothetical protein
MEDLLRRETWIDKRTMTEDVKARALGWAFGAVY